ncbi:MAG: hypothetical protein J6A95_01680 [Clostridia bacterium]|nr:hypothetical protein [Clostridia bacterium]
MLDFILAILAVCFAHPFMFLSGLIFPFGYINAYLYWNDDREKAIATLTGAVIGTIIAIIVFLLFLPFMML